MSLTAMRSARLTAVATALAAFVAAPGVAGAARHVPDNLPLSVKPCKLDTSPAYPSCGTAPSNSVVALKLPDPWFTATPCRLDTSPNYPSCGTDPR